MTRTLSPVVMVAVLLVSTIGGVAVLGGSTAAYQGNAASVYPATTGTSTLGTALFAVKPEDAVAENGIERITLDVGPDASVANVTSRDVDVAVRGGTLFQIDNVNVSSSENGSQLEITLPRTIQPQLGSGSSAGAEVAVKFRNFTTPSEPGSYTIEGTVSTPSGTTDGPARVSYSVSRPTLSFAEQNLSRFSDRQQLTVSASIPGGGYVGLFTTADDGSRGRLVGSTNVSTAPTARNYSVDVTGNVTESRNLTAVAYTESTGLSVSIRRNQTFDPAADDPLVMDGTLLNATASISTADIDGRLQAGSEYDQGVRLYFGGGEPNASYGISQVRNGEVDSSATEFRTDANGTAIVDTGELDRGAYAVTLGDNGSVVDLDGDGTASPADDSFLVTGQQAATTAGNETTTNGTTAGNETTTNGTTAGNGTTTASGTANTTIAGTTADTTTAVTTTETTGANTTAETSTATDEATDATDANGSGAATDAGGANASNDTTEAGGPGFTVIAAVVALLAAALLATTRR